MPVQTRSMTRQTRSMTQSKPIYNSKIQDPTSLMIQILRKNKIGFVKHAHLSWYYTPYMDTFMDTYYTWEKMTKQTSRYKMMSEFVQIQKDNKNI